jgi:hypothetical protein
MTYPVMAEFRTGARRTRVAGRLLGVLGAVTLVVVPSGAAGQPRRWQDNIRLDYLVWITERWGMSDRRLGPLRIKDIPPGDIELRFWGGYGLGGTRGIVLNRTGGQWSARHVTVRRCGLALPLSVADSLSPDSQERYEGEARRRCNERGTDTLSVAAVIFSDTLAIDTIATTADLERTWSDLVAAGVLALPTSVHRSAVMLDGLSYVVEVRVGQEYRVSQIQDWSRDEVPADGAIKIINRILTERVGWR